jgi:hypothetical protein
MMDKDAPERAMYPGKGSVPVELIGLVNPLECVQESEGDQLN